MISKLFTGVLPLLKVEVSLQNNYSPNFFRLKELILVIAVTNFSPFKRARTTKVTPIPNGYCANLKVRTILVRLEQREAKNSAIDSANFRVDFRYLRTDANFENDFAEQPERAVSQLLKKRPNLKDLRNSHCEALKIKIEIPLVSATKLCANLLPYLALELCVSAKKQQHQNFFKKKLTDRYDLLTEVISAISGEVRGDFTHFSTKMGEG